MKTGLSSQRRRWIFAVRGLMGLAAGLTCALVLFLLGYVLLRGIPHITWELLSTAPSVLADRVGILPDILNTVYTVLAAVVIVVPLGAGAAVYLNEYAENKKMVAVIEYAAETLSGIPSIIYGLVGMIMFCGNGSSLLAGALTLVIMNLPTVMRTTQESLKTVPQSYREGAFGLGAGKWRVIRTPAAWTASSPAASWRWAASWASRRRSSTRRASATPSTDCGRASTPPAPPSPSPSTSTPRRTAALTRPSPLPPSCWA